MTTATKRKRPPHWYKTITEECPVCGYGKTHRWYRKGKKPKSEKRRYEYQYRACYGCTFGAY